HGRSRVGGPIVEPSRSEEEAPAGRAARRRILVSGETSAPAPRAADDPAVAHAFDVPVYRPGEAAAQQSVPVSAQTATAQASPAQDSSGALCTGITKNVANSTQQRGFLVKLIDAVFR